MAEAVAAEALVAAGAEVVAVALVAEALVVAEMAGPVVVRAVTTGEEMVLERPERQTLAATAVAAMAEVPILEATARVKVTALPVKVTA